MTKHRDGCRAAVKRRLEFPNDPTPVEIWGPINPKTGLHMGGGRAEQERDNRIDHTDVMKVDLLMLPFGRGKLIGN
jgi:hypothetical protein